MLCRDDITEVSCVNCYIIANKKLQFQLIAIRAACTSAAREAGNTTTKNGAIAPFFVFLLKDFLAFIQCRTELYKAFANLFYKNLLAINDVQAFAWSVHFSTLQIVDGSILSVFTFHIFDGSVVLLN